MKRISCFSFALVLWACSASGQQSFKADDNRFQSNLQWQPPASLQLKGFTPGPDKSLAVITTSRGQVNILSPDRMPCLFSDFAGVERMPIQWSSNGDPMPNGLRASRVVIGHPRFTLVRPDEK